MQKILRWIHGIEDVVLVALLVGMMLLACTQILLRNVFDDAILWADPMLRVMVLWIGLFGAMAATRADKHIRIDLLTRILNPPTARIAVAISNAFAAGVSGLIAWHSARYVLGEYEFASTAFAGIPAWVLAVIIPFGFAVMALRFAVRVFLPVTEQASN